MPQKGSDPVGGKDTAYAKRDWSNTQLKKDASRGMEVPRTDTAAHYRDDMAAQDRYDEKGPFSGRTPQRYYDNFDRGAARDAQKRARRRSTR